MQRKKRKMFTIIAVLAAIAVAGWLLKRERDREDAAKRETQYQGILRQYAVDLKPGMARLQVENSLQKSGKPFKQMCCVANFNGEFVSFDRAGWDDLVKIGEESVPWFCSENNVYVAFEFNPKSAGELPETNSSDILKKVSIFHSLERCL